MPLRKVSVSLLFVCCSLLAGGDGSRAEYAGGTISEIPSGCSGSIQLVDDQYFVFYSNKARWRVPYDRINLIEYGQKASRRYTEAILAAMLSAPVAPFMLLTKKRQHFLTVGYSDDDGHQQAMVFRVNKSDIRIILVGLEARTGRKVEFQDEEARKAGKG